MQLTLRVLVDDVRFFADGRDAIVCRTNAEAVATLQRLHGADLVVDELWLDYDLGRNDDLRPVLELLLNWYDADLPLAVRRVHVHTSSVEGAYLITQVCRRLGYAVEREYGVTRIFSW